MTAIVSGPAHTGAKAARVAPAALSEESALIGALVVIPVAAAIQLLLRAIALPRLTEL